MAEAALGPEAGPNLVHTLFHRSEGLPLIAEEDLITLSERVRQGDRTNTEAFAVDPEQAAVPTGLREAVSERVANLSASGVAVTEAAAVLALPSTEQMLTAVTGLPSDRGSQGLTEALRAFTLDESQPAHYAFRRVLAQQAVYERIPGPERQRLHRRAADALRVQTPQPLMQIAHRTLALGDREGWLDYAEAAVDQATEVGDAGTATRVLRDILAQTHLSGDLRSRAALALARIAVQGVDAVNSQSVLWQILADPQLPTADCGEVRLALGMLMVGQAGDAAGFAEIEQAARELADRPGRAVRAMAALAINERDGAWQLAPVWLDRADDVLRQYDDEAGLRPVRPRRFRESSMPYPHLRTSAVRVRTATYLRCYPYDAWQRGPHYWSMIQHAQALALPTPDIYFDNGYLASGQVPQLRRLFGAIAAGKYDAVLLPGPFILSLNDAKAQRLVSWMADHGCRVEELPAPPHRVGSPSAKNRKYVYSA